MMAVTIMTVVITYLFVCLQNHDFLPHIHDMYWIYIAWVKFTHPTFLPRSAGQMRPRPSDDNDVGDAVQLSEVGLD